MPELPLAPEQDPSSTPASSLPPGRYGTARARTSPAARRVLVIVGGLVVISLVAWLAFSQEGNDVRGRDVGYSVISPEVVEITFDVAKPRDATVICTLEALNSSFAQVGTREVTVGPSKVAEARYTTEIATSEEAVTAVVTGCRPVDQP